MTPSQLAQDYATEATLDVESTLGDPPGALLGVSVARVSAALARGEAMLEAGAVSHNHMFFRREAIDICLGYGDPAGADNISARAMKREPTRIVANHAADHRTYLIDNAVFKFDFPHERYGHFSFPRLCHFEVV